MGIIAKAQPGTAARSLDRARGLEQLNAFVTLVDRPGTPADGPLTGLPFAVKDNIDTAGLRTTYGSRHFERHSPSADAACVDELLHAGAVLVGKTTTHEFAYGPTGVSSLNGPALNPHDNRRMTGGSSAGSASAVAAGIVPLALGTDTGGSARIPASLCGAIGFKPTFGTLSLEGVFPLSPSLDTLGLITADACLLERVWHIFRPGAARRSRLERVGLLTSDSLFPADPEIDRVVQNFLRILDPRDVSLPELRSTWQVYRHIQGSEAHALHRERLDRSPELFGPDVLERLRAAGQILGWEYVAARQEQARLQESLLSVFDSVDVLALPTTPVVAPPIGANDTLVAGRPMLVRDALLGLTSPWSVLGWPAVSVPAGFVGGLPTGVQLVAPPGRDAELIELVRRICPHTVSSTTKEQS